MWYFNAKIRYYCSLDIIQYKKLAWGGRNYVEKTDLSFFFNLHFFSPYFNNYFLIHHQLYTSYKYSTLQYIITITIITSIDLHIFLQSIRCRGSGHPTTIQESQKQRSQTPHHREVNSPLPTDAEQTHATPTTKRQRAGGASPPSHTLRKPILIFQLIQSCYDNNKLKIKNRIN